MDLSGLYAAKEKIEALNVAGAEKNQEMSNKVTVMNIRSEMLANDIMQVLMTMPFQDLTKCKRKKNFILRLDPGFNMVIFWVR